MTLYWIIILTMLTLFITNIHESYSPENSLIMFYKSTYISIYKQKCNYLWLSYTKQWLFVLSIWNTLYFDSKWTLCDIQAIIIPLNTLLELDTKYYWHSFSFRTTLLVSFLPIFIVLDVFKSLKPKSYLKEFSIKRKKLFHKFDFLSKRSDLVRNLSNFGGNTTVRVFFNFPKS